MRRLLMVLSVTVLLASCANGDTPAIEEEDTTSPAPTAAEIQTSATAQVAETSLGEVLVDGEGMTLYLFTRDTETTSACEGDCLQTWPPLIIDGEPEAGEGVDGSRLGTITRPDGTTQVTYGGHPLYTFADDEAAGDVNGQGVGGVWFAVTAEGEAAEGGG